MPIVDKYDFTPEAIKVIKDYAPHATPPAELIRCHFVEMDGPTRERAIKTLEELEGRHLR